MLLVDDLAAGGTKNLRHTPRGLVTLVEQKQVCSALGNKTQVYISIELSSILLGPASIRINNIHVNASHARIQKVLSEMLTLTTSFLVDEGRADPYQRAIISPPAKRHLMAFRWRSDDGPTLDAGLVAL